MAGPEPRDLGHELTNGNGLILLTYFAPRPSATETEAAEGEEEPEGRRLRVQVVAADGEEIHQAEIRAPVERTEVIEIRVPMPEVEACSPTLAELADAVEIDLPEGLRLTLAGHGIHSLADIRERGIRGLEGVEPDHPVIPVLEAHAGLSTLSPSLEANATLIDAGYNSISAIAGATRVDVVGAANEVLGDFGAARLRVEADAQKQLLNNIIATVRADRANGLPASSPAILPDDVLSDVFPDSCGCRDCAAAVSPTAYLAELLDYAVTHLRQGNDRSP